MEGKLIYPELSYTIIGLAYEIFNEMGYGVRERYYQESYAQALLSKGINFERERFIVIKCKDKTVGKCFLDFVIDNKVIVELKVRPRFGYTDIKQVMSYLKAANLKLAILIYFTREGVKFRRILNST